MTAGSVEIRHNPETAMPSSYHRGRPARQATADQQPSHTAWQARGEPAHSRGTASGLRAMKRASTTASPGGPAPEDEWQGRDSLRTHGHPALGTRRHRASARAGVVSVRPFHDVGDNECRCPCRRFACDAGRVEMQRRGWGARLSEGTNREDVIDTSGQRAIKTNESKQNGYTSEHSREARPQPSRFRR